MIYSVDLTTLTSFLIRPSYIVVLRGTAKRCIPGGAVESYDRMATHSHTHTRILAPFLQGVHPFQSGLFLAAAVSIKIQVRCSTVAVSKECFPSPLHGNYIVNFTAKSKLGQAKTGTTKKKKKEQNNLIKNRVANRDSALFCAWDFYTHSGDP